MGAATQSTGRGLPENPAQGVRRTLSNMNNMANMASVPVAPPMPPIPNIRTVPSNSSLSLSASAPMSASQVIILAREAMRSALDENVGQAAEASAVSTELKPGVTIDLSRKNIQRLPDEVVDVIKNELERLVSAYHHRQMMRPANQP